MSWEAPGLAGPPQFLRKPWSKRSWKSSKGEKGIGKSQYGFIKGKSHLRNLTALCDESICSADEELRLPQPEQCIWYSLSKHSCWQVGKIQAGQMDYKVSGKSGEIADLQGWWFHGFDSWKDSQQETVWYLRKRNLKVLNLGWHSCKQQYKTLCWKGPGGQQAEHEAATCPFSGGKTCPRLHQQEHS